MDGPVVGSAVFELRAIRQKLKQDLDDSRRDLIGWIDQAERDAGAGGNRIGGAISGLVGKMTTVVTGLVTLLGLAAAGALNLGVQGLRMADDLANSARKVGVGTDALQEWRFVAQQTGADAKDADKALDSFANKLAQATAGTSKSAVKAFGFLKIGPEELRGFKSTEEALDYVTDAIKNLKSEADRAAIAEQLGLGPLSNALRDSAVDVATLRDEARSLGIVMDQEMIRRASAAQGEFDTLSQVIDIQLKSAFLDLVPAIMTVVGWVSQLAVALSDAMDAWRQLDDRTTRGLDRQLQRLTVENSNLMLRYGSVEAMKGREADRAAVVGASGGAAGPGGAIMARSMGPNAYETFTRNQEQINEIYRLKNERALTAAPQRTDRATGGTLDIPAPRVPVDRSAEREARRAERVEAEINKLRARALGIIDEETMTVQQRFDSETAQLEAERAAERAQLDSREARKDITKAERQQLDAANREVALREDRVRNAILLRDLDAERIAQERMVSDLTVQLLSLQSGAAKSAAARRVIELELLKEAQRRAREDLQRDPNFLKASPQSQKAMLADQDRVFKAQTEGVIRDTMGPLDKWRDRALTDADQIREAYERVAVDGLDALNAGLVDAIVNSRNLGDVFSNVARQIIADLAAIAVRQSITEPLARSLFGSGDAATVGAKAVTASQGASWLTKIAGFLGFAGGGRVSGPGSDKSDSILARLSNGEFVINAEQTRRHLPLLEMINGGGLPGFANGGLAMGMTPDGDGAYVTLSGAVRGDPVSLVNSLLTAEACLVVCDTQAGTFRATGPTGFASKVVPIQRLGVLIASTGSGDLFDRWLTHLQLSIGADLDEVLSIQPALLRGIYGALDGRSAHRSSLFIWGWSRQAQRVQGWIMHSRDDFEPVALADGYTLKPPPSDMAALEALPTTGSSLDRMVEIVAQQVADDRERRARSEYISATEGASDPLLLGGDLLAFVLRAPTTPGGSVHIESWTVGPIEGAENDRLRVLMSGHGGLDMTLHRIRMNRRAERIGRPIALALLWCERVLALLRLHRRS